MHSRAIAVVTLLMLAACAGNDENRPPQSAYEQQPGQAENQPQQQQNPQQMGGTQGQQDGTMQGSNDQQNTRDQFGRDSSMQHDQNMQGQGMQGQDNNQNMQQGMQGQQNQQQGSATETLTDEHFVVLANVANTHEIEEARLAQQKAKDARVKRYAAMMQQDHTLARDQEQKLITRLKLKPQESEQSRKMEMDFRADLDRLRSLSGSAFDRQYMQDMVQDHTALLTLIDTKILPNVKTQELKAHFEGLRPKVAKHLSEAQDLQRQIGTAPVSSR